MASTGRFRTGIAMVSCSTFKLHILDGQDAHPTRVVFNSIMQIRCFLAYPLKTSVQVVSYNLIMFAYYEWGVRKVVKDGFNHCWYNLRRCITNSVFLPSDACGGLRLRIYRQLVMLFCIHTNIFRQSRRLRSLVDGFIVHALACNLQNPTPLCRENLRFSFRDTT